MTTNVLSLEQCKRMVEFVGAVSGKKSIAQSDGSVLTFNIWHGLPLWDDGMYEDQLEEYMHSDDFLPVLLRALIPKCAEIEISAGRNSLEYASLSIESAGDYPDCNFRGPLNGNGLHALLLCVDEALEKGVLK